jgi:hypothetical protein
MALVTLPRQYTADINGEPRVGALLYVYDAGTNNTRTVYTAKDFSVELNQPIQSVEGGIFPAIYVNPDGGDFKITIQDSSGALIYTEDNIPAQLGVTDIDLAGVATESQTTPIIYSLRRTQAEVIVGVIPTNYAYDPLDVRRYGAMLDNSTNDYAAINAADLVAYTQGGGIVHGYNGKTAKCTTRMIFRDHVIHDFGGGGIRHVLVGTGDDSGPRLRSYAQLWNGTLSTEASGTYGTQAGIMAGLCIGALTGDAGTVASPAADATIVGCRLYNMTLKTNAAGHGALVINGDVSDVIIDGLVVPDSAAMFVALQCEYNFLGTITSSGITANRANFDAGTAYTIHPHDIQIRNVRIGSLTAAYSGDDTGASGIRILGCHNVTVDGVVIDSVTNASAHNSAGALGYEFAQGAVKPFANSNVVFRNILCKSTKQQLIHHNAYANQVASAVALGYSAILDPLTFTNVVYENCVGYGDPLSASSGGILVKETRGGEFINCEASGFYYGFSTDVKTYQIKIRGGRYYNNRADGVLLSATTDPPEDALVENVYAYDNGTTVTTSGGITTDSAIRPTIRGCICGNQFGAETHQAAGIKVTSSTKRAKILNNHVASVKAGGLAYSLAGTTDYGTVDLFAGNTTGDNITRSESCGGINIIPVTMGTDPSGTLPTRTFLALSTSTPPTAGTWRRGDVIYSSDQAASTSMGDACVLSGTFSAATDNTGDTDGSTGVITGMTDTSDFFVGEFVTASAGFASTGPHRILAKTASSITVDASSNSSQSNITVSTPDPTFKALPALGA